MNANDFPIENETLENETLARISNESDPSGVADAIGTYIEYLDKDEAICLLRMTLLKLYRDVSADELRSAWTAACDDYHSFGLR